MVETYVFKKGFVGDYQTASLKTIKAWYGTASQDIRFRADTTPWVVNGGYTSTSQVSSSFSLTVGQATSASGIEMLENTYTTRTGISTILVEEKGTFTIHVKASGVNWWVKVGVE
jgi:hypothetical protein